MATALTRLRLGLFLGAGCATGLVLFVVGFAITGTESPAPKDVASTAVARLSLADAQADYEQFATILTDEHPKLFTDRAKLAEAIATQRTLLREGMSEVEFLRVLAPASHATLCGHTRLLLPEKSEAAFLGRTPLLPFAVRVVDRHLFVYENRSAAAIAPGSEILSLNGRSAEQILESLVGRLPVEGENRTLTYRLCDKMFPVLYAVLLDSAQEFSVTYLAPSEQSPRSVVVAGVPNSPSPPAPEAKPPEEPNRTLFTPTHAILTIGSFNFYADGERKKFRAFVEAFFAEAHARKTPNIVLDLRDNGGGDPYCAASVFTHLIERPTAYFAADTPFYGDLKRPLKPAPHPFTGKLIVLINGGCFSTTGHLCALLKFHHRGFFVGEETGGSFICTDGSQTTTLTHSGLRFHHSTRAFKVAVSGLPFGRGTMPDESVAPTIADALQHRDPVMARALTLFEASADAPRRQGE